MYNKYAIAIASDTITGLGAATISIWSDKLQQVEKAPLGTLFQPNKLETKEDFIKFFTSIGSIIYGAEEKSKQQEVKESKSFERVLTLIQTENSAG